ncbi:MULTISPECIES: PilZ domain-containing protein [Paenibacillus]|uniref:PilZ domain-containing protein n=1 Tax=Paenibacillus TaxID=44249 RepID=UPI0022B91A8C|nr:PilZ domain-containing protein [Paenibacillus caseinilyticus]MCZ8522782.1 PilZ domain-containing protein [Paenibacillus caseinilyticus]
MNWNQILAAGMLPSSGNCSLVIIGETKEGQPFCYQDEFRLVRADEHHITVTLETPAIHPLEKLHHVSFVEFSYLEDGILHFALVGMEQLEMRRSLCTLTLSAPEAMQKTAQRKHERAPLVVRTPVTCRIVGIRGQAGQQSVTFTGQILDLSGGGIAFVTPARLLRNLDLEFTFVLPTLEQKLTAFGEVVRISHFGSDAYRVAARFRHVPDSLAVLIDEYCIASTAHS